MSAVALEIVAIDSGEVVHRIDLQPDYREGRMLDRVMSGVLRTVDTERFYVREVEAGSEA